MPHQHASSSYVFVYGTLRRGGTYDIRRFSPAPRFVAQARLKGTLFDLGAYPGLQLNDGDWVLGEVFEIEPSLEVQLDRLEEVDGEQGEYLKRWVQVEAAGALLRCLVYEIHPSRLPGRRVLAGGDWIVHFHKDPLRFSI